MDVVSHFKYITFIKNSHHFQEFQVVLKIPACPRLHQVPGDKEPRENEETWTATLLFMFFFLIYALTGRPSSPSAPLSPWNSRKCSNFNKIFGTFTGNVEGGRAYINAINSWYTCRSRRARRSFTPLSKIKDRNFILESSATVYYY